MKEDEYRRLMNTLNRKQFTFMINCLNKIKSNEVFYDLVVGESGTGKSNLIKALDQCVDKYLRSVDNSDPEKERVMLCSFTGKASFNISGVTLHSALHLQVKNGVMKPLSVQSAEKIGKTMSKLRLLIIDEISMVGSSLFKWVDQRLRQIKKDERPFGGVSVVLLGDFNQLPPVKDSWIFKEGRSNGSNAYTDLVNNAQATSMLWSLFRLYRLTEIMRQQGDKTFAQALSNLGNYGLCGLSDQQVALLNSRIVDQNTIPNDAIYLYRVNTKKDEMCAKQLEARSGEVFVNQAKHIAKGEGDELARAQKYMKTYGKMLSAEHFSQLTRTVQLKEGVQYMLFQNIDLSDGLCNGSSGVLRRIEKVRDTDDDVVRAHFVWIEFSDANVGVKLRTKFAHIYANKRKEGIVIPDSWTPLFPTKASYRAKASCKWTVERVQLPIEIAEAITIDKSQGQTYARVAFELAQNNRAGYNCLTRAHLYVAWSRVRRLEDLFLFGGRSIVEGKRFENWPEQERQEEAKAAVAKDEVNIEMRRMETEAKFENRFPFLEESYQRPALAVCMLNVAGLRFHLDSIRSDFGMRNADVLIFVETAVRTGTSYEQEFKIDNFKLLRMGSSREDGSKIGCAVYIADRIAMSRVRFYGDNSKHGDGVYKGHHTSELALFGIDVDGNEVLFLYCYNHPKSSCKEFLNELASFLKHYNLHNDSNRKTLYILGDMNVDLKRLNNNIVNYKMFSKYSESLVLLKSEKYENNLTSLFF